MTRFNECQLSVTGFIPNLMIIPTIMWFWSEVKESSYQEFDLGRFLGASSNTSTDVDSEGGLKDQRHRLDKDLLHLRQLRSWSETLRDRVYH